MYEHSIVQSFSGLKNKHYILKIWKSKKAEIPNESKQTTNKRNVYES